MYEMKMKVTQKCHFYLAVSSTMHNFDFFAHILTRFILLDALFLNHYSRCAP